MINFVCMPERTSGLIRGRQVADALREDAVVVDVHKIDLDRPLGNDVSLFIRSWDGYVAKRLKNRGHRVGYDVADQMVGDCVFRNKEVTNLAAYAHPECDFYIVNNTVTMKDLEPFADGKPIYVVPHHTVNYERHVNVVKPSVLRVGYVGLAEQLSAKDDIERLCREHDAEFTSVHPNTREECVDVMKSIDVGVVFAEGDGQLKPRAAELMYRYKPATKVTNFQSFGIPTVAVPYESYKEFSGGHCFFVETKEALLSRLKCLLLSDEARSLLAHASAWNGAKYHIDEVVKLYKNIVLDLDAVRDT